MSRPRKGQPNSEDAGERRPKGRISLAPEAPRAAPQPKTSLELDLDELRDHSSPVLELADRSARSLSVRPTPSSPMEKLVPPELASRDALLADLRSRHELGDFTGALEVAERLLAADPGDTEAARYAELFRGILTEMHTARLGSLRGIPAVCIPEDRVRWLSLDHRAGFLLSLVDGRSSVEELLDMSGMPRLDALLILHELKEQGIIEVTAASE